MTFSPAIGTLHSSVQSEGSGAERMATAIQQLFVKEIE